MGRRGVLAVVSMFALALSLAGAAAGSETNPRVTNDDAVGTYLRYDGTQDPTMQSCSTARTAQNEPTIAVDPRNTSVVVAGANDVCGPGAGYYRSVDGGLTWKDSLVPNYAADTSAAALASPTHGTCAGGGDPSQSFDNQGRLFYGYICFNFVHPTNGGVYVTTYDQDGAHYARTVQVARGVPGDGVFNDKDNIAVDQTIGQNSGNVYFAWARYVGTAPNNRILFSRSIDHGATFSKPVAITPGLTEEQFADVAVGPDGAIYVAYHTYPGGKIGNAVYIVKSTDGGQSFGRPSLVSPFVPFSSVQFTGEPYATIDEATTACGDAAPCPSGLTFSRFDSLPAVAADATGVHVVWSAELPSGQAKIFVRNSPDGVSWPTPATTLDTVAIGHQYFPDIASADGRITVVFYDSRVDPAYSVNLPPGDNPDGTNSGGAVNTYIATSTDGGVNWSERQVSTFASNYNLEVYNPPFFGDYIYVSAVPGAVNVVWTSSSDVGVCSYCTPNGFTVNVGDENIYNARVFP